MKSHVQFNSNKQVTPHPHFYSKFKNELRIIPASAEEQSLEFSIKVHFL